MIRCQNPTRLLTIFRCDTVRRFYFLRCFIHQESLLVACFFLGDNRRVDAVVVRLVHFSYDLTCGLGGFCVIDCRGEIFGAVGIGFRPLKFALDADSWSMAFIILEKLKTGGLFAIAIILG